MREILFRGKRVDDGKWVNGYFVYDESGQITEEDTAYIYYLNTHTCGWDLIPFKVIPETVGQYTGLTDKNGTKIFEGDIVKNFSSGDIAYVVEYHGSYCLWDFEEYVDDFLWNWCSSHIDHGEDIGGCIVIGNIHDNPELLEVRENA